MQSCGLILIGLLLVVPAWSQQKVDATNSYHRVLAIVPLVGKGTWDDPKRPMFAPVASSATDRTGIIAFQHQVSDDGNFALTEFVAANRAALSQILSANNPLVIAFEVGAQPQAAIAATFQKYKQTFSFSQFKPVRVP